MSTYSEVADDSVVEPPDLKDVGWVCGVGLQVLKDRVTLVARKVILVESVNVPTNTTCTLGGGGANIRMV